MLAPLGLALLMVAVVASCARMGQPDGGWYDETPPKVIGATPADRGVNVSAKKVNIFFDEYIKIENPSERWWCRLHSSNSPRSRRQENA